ncbi:cysteine ABC transporter substrate-binding protein [Niallia sp. 01092]|uniref:cysteine ABC transporter substrate-binding protein n=1 Tax=unclassified Niallia TaxID=2837522 RepID=UPI003FD0FBC1
MRNFKKTILGLLAFSLFAFVLVGCGKNNDSKNSESNNPSSVEAIKKRGKIKIAVFGDLSPYGYIDKDGKNQGYDVYLAKRIAKDLLGDESKVEFVIVNAEERVDALKSNKVDLVLANFTVTPERKEQVDFANPYMKVGIGVVSPKSSLITDVSQLKGKKLIVNKGTTAEIYFTQNEPDVSLEKYDSKTQQFQALKDGRALALADDNSYLYAWVKNNPDYTVAIKELGKSDYIAPAVKKGNTSLLNWVNDELATLGKEQFFHKDYDEQLKPFFGADISADDIVVEGKAE